jgi:hypothetical protein
VKKLKEEVGKYNEYIKIHLVEGTHNRLCWTGALMGIGSFRPY